MRRFTRRPEGPGLDPKLVELYKQFEEMREIEGPGAADEGDISRLMQEMTEACVSHDENKFLASLSKAMMLHSGITNIDHLSL